MGLVAGARPGPRFENLVACQLLKYCHYREDTDRREVDFVALQDGEPSFAVECKAGERAASPAAACFRERTPIRDFYQVHLGSQDKRAGGTRVLPFRTFCNELGMP